MVVDDEKKKEKKKKRRCRCMGDGRVDLLNAETEARTGEAGYHQSGEIDRKEGGRGG